jgi:hypothetical protein
MLVPSSIDRHPNSCVKVARCCQKQERTPAWLRRRRAIIGCTTWRHAIARAAAMVSGARASVGANPLSLQNSVA